VIDSLLAGNKYYFALSEHVEGGVHGPNQTQRESNDAHNWQVSPIPHGGSIPGIFPQQISSLGKYLW
jgi:hypothetical protein